MDSKMDSFDDRSPTPDRVQVRLSSKVDSFDDRSPTPDRVQVRRFASQPDSFDDRSPTPKRQDRHELSFQDSIDSFGMPSQEQELPWSSDFGSIDFGPDEKSNPYDTTAQIASSSSQVLFGSDAPLTTPETSPVNVGKTYTLIPQEIISLKAAIKELDHGLVATNKVLQATNKAMNKAMRKMQKQIDDIEKSATLH
jgi:hypothetical protein